MKWTRGGQFADRAALWVDRHANDGRKVADVAGPARRFALTGFCVVLMRCSQDGLVLTEPKPDRPRRFNIPQRGTRSGLGW